MIELVFIAACGIKHKEIHQCRNQCERQALVGRQMEILHFAGIGLALAGIDDGIMHVARAAK